MEAPLQARASDPLDHGALALSDLTAIGIGVLSWRGYRSLDAMLHVLATSGLPSQLGERLVFLPEEEAQGREIAARYGFAHAGSPANLGILGGFRALAEAMESEFVLLLENDIHLSEPLAEAERQLGEGLRLLREGQAHVVQMRSRRAPGDPFSALQKYARYHPPADAALAARVMGALRRAVRPGKARRFAGTAPFVEAAPEVRFPRQVRRDRETGFAFLSSRDRGWSNQPFLIGRRFFLDVILARADAVESRRRVNGFKNIEIELNDRWWRDQDFTIAMAPGLFTHVRLDDRGY